MIRTCTAIFSAVAEKLLPTDFRFNDGPGSIALFELVGGLHSARAVLRMGEGVQSITLEMGSRSRLSPYTCRLAMKTGKLRSLPVLSLGDICGIKCGGTIIPANWRGDGKADFSWRGRLCDRLEISCGGSGQAAAGGLRIISGNP